MPWDYTALEVLKAELCSEQPGIVEGVSVHVEELKINGFSSLFQPKPFYDSMMLR